MPKLYFYYGAMNSSKSTNLLMVTHNYESQGKKPLLIKPKLDTRFGDDVIMSRTGLSKKANIILDTEDSLLNNGVNYYDYDVIIVDEANFLTPKQIKELRTLTSILPVLAYGLKTNYKLELFPGSAMLLCIADNIVEIKTICHFCEKKAIFNMKHINGKAIKEGSDEPDLGTEDKYLACCWECYNKH